MKLKPLKTSKVQKSKVKEVNNLKCGVQQLHISELEVWWKNNSQINLNYTVIIR
jgi:hypothetical protein